MDSLVGWHVRDSEIYLLGFINHTMVHTCTIIKNTNTSTHFLDAILLLEDRKEYRENKPNVQKNGTS